LKEGVWIKKPNLTIEANCQINIGSYAHEFGQGTEGLIQFKVEWEGKDHVIEVYWKNPFTGKNVYTGTNFKIERGGGNNSQVEFTFTGLDLPSQG